MTKPLRGCPASVHFFSISSSSEAGRTRDAAAAVADRDLGPGVEMVAFQSLRGWPRLDDTSTREGRGLIEDSGLTPSCLAINLDLGLYPGRLLSDDEAYDYVAVQLRGAAALGFPTVRVGIESTPPILSRLLPLAEELGVKIGVEIHAPLTIEAPPVAALKDFFTDIDTPLLGFIHFSASMRRTRRLATRTLTQDLSRTDSAGKAFWAEP